MIGFGRIWSHLLGKSLMENFIFHAALVHCGKEVTIATPETTETFLVLLT